MKRSEIILDIFSQILFTTFLGLIFIYEGFGLRFGREISYFIILAMPFFLFFIDIINKKEIVVPKKITILFIFFVIFSIISTIYSLNVERSFEYLLYYLSTFLMFLYVFNHKQLQKLIIIFIFAISFIFISYSTYINYFLPKDWSFLIPSRGYQYVYAFFKTHNPLGTLLLIPLTFSFSYFIGLGKKTFLILFLIILPFFLLSYSRSGYLAFIIGGLILLISQVKNKRVKVFSKTGLFATTVFVACLFLFVSTVNYQSSPSFIKSVNNFLSTNFRLNTKTFLSERDQYFRSALLSIRERPLFGVGPANFIFASSKYAQSFGSLAETADNIFLEVFSENGVLAGIIFVLVILLLLTKADKKNKAIFITFLTTLLLYMTDSSQRYYSHYLLFFIIAGLLYSEKSYIKAKYLIFAITLLLFLAVNSMFISRFLYDQKNYKTAFYFYPLDKQVFEGYLTTIVFKKDNQYWRLYERLFNGDPSALTLIGGINLYVKNNDEALAAFKKINQYYPYSVDYFYIFKSMYELESILNGKERAGVLANKYFKRLETGNRLGRFDYLYGQQARNLCWFVYGFCPFDL